MMGKGSCTSPGGRFTVAMLVLLLLPSIAGAAGKDKPKLTGEEKRELTKLLRQVKDDDADAASLTAGIDVIAAMGAQALPQVEKELRTKQWRDRWHYLVVVAKVQPENAHDVFAEELPAFLEGYRRLQKRMLENQKKSHEYGQKAQEAYAASLRGAGSSGDHERYDRLASQYANLMNRDFDQLYPCQKAVRLCGEYFAVKGGKEDILLLTEVLEDGIPFLQYSRNKPLEPFHTGRVTKVVRGRSILEDETPVSFCDYSITKPKSTFEKELKQDWVPWSSVWASVRTLTQGCDDKATLMQCQDRLRKAVGRFKGKSAEEWVKRDLLAEYERTNMMLGERIALLPDPKKGKDPGGGG